MKNFTTECIKRNVYLDYLFEEVMGRTTPSTKSQKKPKVRHFIKFYGEKEIAVPSNHLMILDVIRFGEEIMKEQYEKGKKGRFLLKF